MRKSIVCLTALVLAGCGSKDAPAGWSQINAATLTADPITTPPLNGTIVIPSSDEVIGRMTFTALIDQVNLVSMAVTLNHEMDWANIEVFNPQNGQTRSLLLNTRGRQFIFRSTPTRDLGITIHAGDVLAVELTTDTSNLIGEDIEVTVDSFTTASPNDHGGIVQVHFYDLPAPYTLLIR